MGLSSFTYTVLVLHSQIKGIKRVKDVAIKSYKSLGSLQIIIKEVSSSYTSEKHF